MDLKGAEIRNIYNLCRAMNSTDSRPLMVNIPHYQRPYKWDEDRIKNLIQDFKKNLDINESETEYFVGSVVLVEGKGASSSRHDVIDGQQRITTVFLMNYLRFLLLRARAEDGIERRASASIGEILTSLASCCGELLGGSTKQEKINELKESIVTTIDDLDGSDPTFEETKWEELLLQFRETLCLPDKDLKDISQLEWVLES